MAQIDSAHASEPHAGAARTDPPSNFMKRQSVLVIFVTVFIDLIGFGIVVPLVPIYGKHFGAGEAFMGIIVASFSAMQFLFAPLWGRWSDRIGRRPVLLLSTAGAAVSYVGFAIGSGLPSHTTALRVLLASRVFAGICGGNIGVAQAYIADITPSEDRSRRMGLVGMAFGLGFICGPILGGLSLKYLGGLGPGAVAASLCAINFVFAWFILAESRSPASERVVARPHWDQWMHTLRQPKVGLLVVVFFLATFCFSCFESTLPILVCENFQLDILADERTASTAVFLFAYCGIIGALVQGGAVGHMVKKMGEPRLITLSLLLAGIGLATLPFIRGTGQLSWSGLVPTRRFALAQSARDAGGVVSRIEPDPAAPVWPALQPDSHAGAGSDDWRGAKRRQPGANPRPALRLYTVWEDAFSAVSHVRIHFPCHRTAGRAATLAWQRDDHPRRCLTWRQSWKSTSRAAQPQSRQIAGPGA